MEGLTICNTDCDRRKTDRDSGPYQLSGQRDNIQCKTHTWN